MFSSIMKILARKESLSMTQLAREVGHSVREVESILEQMEHMGYVRRELFGQSCSSGCGVKQCNGHCEGCGFASSDTFSIWLLTERGQKIVSSQHKCR